MANPNFWGNKLPTPETKKPEYKVIKRRKECVLCLNKWIIMYDTSKPLVERILCENCRQEIENA